MKLRREKGLTRRGFAIAINLDPAYYGRIERGEVAPPSETVLARMGEQLGMQVGVSFEWYEFVDFAAVSRGRIPSDLAENEATAAFLPALFARLREQPELPFEELHARMMEIARERRKDPPEKVVRSTVGAFE